MPGELNEAHIQKTAKILQIPADYVRKDYYVTKVIHILSSIENDYFSLIFQGEVV